MKIRLVFIISVMSVLLPSFNILQAAVMEFQNDTISEISIDVLDTDDKTMFSTSILPKAIRGGDIDTTKIDSIKIARINGTPIIMRQCLLGEGMVPFFRNWLIWTWRSNR